MANFSKYKKATISQKQTVPSKIYESLDRKSEAGPLRPTQDRILTEWYSNRRQDRDIIIKLPTGSGKLLLVFLLVFLILIVTVVLSFMYVPIFI